jgi:XTP/dITP diphosphohydrolase
MKLLIATRNAHKLEEIRAIFNFPFDNTQGRQGLEIVSAFDFPDVPDTIEDRDTFEGNAIKKAQELCDATGLPAIADDSGLEVDALDGAPGVYSARYAGEPCDYKANNQKLLRELGDNPNRRARFVTVLAFCRPNEEPLTIRGTCEGQIITEERGEHGFGYDPLFIPDGYPETFAELPAEIKNKISHRANALNEASKVWKHFFNH